MRVLFVVLLAISALGGGAWLEFERVVNKSLLIEKSISFTVPPGASAKDVSRSLASLGLVDDPHAFMWLAYVDGAASRLRAGEYMLTPGMTVRGVLSLLTSGRVIQHTLTIVEGWRFAEVRTILAQESRLKQTLRGKTGEEIMDALGYAGLHPEGRFFPDTYHYVRGSSDLDLLRRAFEAMSAALDEEWTNRSPDLPLRNADEALTLASIIEKETGLASERREISGVFTRRLKKGMKLQTDPTVIYGLGDEFDGNLRRADLTRRTPYNTYVNRGLPPTPIALPGRASIHAAVNPDDGDSLYFVARGDGGHAFAKTLDEHNRNVKRYQLGR